MKALLGLLLAALLVPFSGVACAQSYPSKPVRLIIPFPPGGSNDVVGRAIGQQLSERLGQGVVIDNRGGAGGIIGTEQAAKSPPDGYTLLLISVAFPTSIAFNRLPHDVMKSFDPVAMLGSGPALLVVPASSPANSVAELMNLLRQKPGELNAAAAGIGSFQHMATELFRLQSKTKFVIVQYKGGGPALTAVLSGESDLSFLGVVPASPHVKSGRLRALGITSLRRSEVLPGVPTVAEAGVKGYEFAAWYGILAPAGTPAPVVAALNGHIVKAMRSPEVVKRVAQEGADIIAGSPGEFAAYVKSELQRWAAVVKAAGVRAD